MLFLYAVARPISLNAFAGADVMADDPSINSSCNDIDKCRTITDILWNCYSVVILCTWVAVHPNVPTVGDHFTVVLMKYGLIAFMAVVAPELMILWALRQWVSCLRITRKYKKYGWKKCHAFLVLMGGLALYDDDTFVCYLWDRPSFNHSIDRNTGEYCYNRDVSDSWEFRLAVGIGNGWTLDEIVQRRDKPLLEQECSETAPSELAKRYSCLLEYLLARGHIRMTQDEIRDKGHADALTKTIALVQTLWFILQCVARVIQGLEVTALEVVVFAFAVLNFITYFLWWNKPLRVRHPIRVYWQLHPPALKLPREKFWTNLLCRLVRYAVDACGTGINAAVMYVADDYHSLSNERIFAFLKSRIFSPLYPIVALGTRFRDLGAGIESDNCRYLFSSRLDKDTIPIHAITYIVAILFAAIHLIPWFFSFPTAIERTLWRISAVFATSAPIIFSALHLSGKYIIRKIVEKMQEGTTRRRYKLEMVLQIVGTLWMVLMFLLFAVYVPARLALIVLALTALRDLHRDGYEAVQWNTYMPHIG
ncbi:hypothetical protein Moror_2006 [Moniliophthora roreri MCA 2997]|uniref:Uncharacterized protein n=2 Tax=Moniliophthora roreri TaxID=221103 RepID=V2X161_MONRO|nr:hypothetical protein Moror_2006 [Moniliophthora roreri MCA 2997]KAI3621000.1 hypothetical protein WG66_014576 [Moniliophthora roreri]